MASRFDAFSAGELDAIWVGLHDVREDAKSKNENGVFTERIDLISAMFSEMYLSGNFGKREDKPNV